MQVTDSVRIANPACLDSFSSTLTATPPFGSLPINRLFHTTHFLTLKIFDMEDVIGPIFVIGFVVFILASLWKVFVKAGREGWEALIPIYNIYVLLKIVGKPGWWLLLFLVPIVSLVVSFIVYIELAKRFGKSTGFGVGLVLLSFIFIPILAFGDAQYQGVAGGEGSYDDVIQDIGS